jgi:hypothetical protein
MPRGKYIRKSSVPAVPSTASDTAEKTAIVLSAKVRKVVEDVRKPFMSFTTSFGALAVTRAELAPLFMRAFGVWQTETGAGFVDFVRELDPAIGPGRATPLDGMARVLSSVLPLIQSDQVAKLWAAIGAELHWTPRQITTLQKRVEASAGLVRVSPLKGTPVPQLRIASVRHSHSESTESAAA